MEIKKGISQMVEYPNREINYVVPADGQMYYVLKDGVLNNGAVIATLDPKRAIDEGIICDNIGVFSADGSVLIDFDKREIRKVTDDLLLVVNSKPVSEEVIRAQEKINDDMFKNIMKENQISIIDKIMREMGITGEMLFSDAYLEANIYKVDSYNNKVGIEASFIGKNDKELFFHTNDINKESTRIKYVSNNASYNFGKSLFDLPTEVDNSSTQDLKLDISNDILEGFKNKDEEEVNTQEKTAEEEKKEEQPKSSEDNKEENTNSEEKNDNKNEKSQENNVTEQEDQVLDNVIDVMKKMIEETGKLNERIEELEKELEEKNKELQEKTSKLEEQESKKNELSSLLSEANEVLENIDEK